VKNNFKERGLIITATLIPVTVCFIYFRYVVPYHVCFKEQIQMFVLSSSFVLPYFSKPAALACLGGDFLTQLLYFKWSGAVVVTLLLATEWLLIFLVLKRFFVKFSYAASLLIVAVEWIFFSSIFFYLSYSVSFIIFLVAFLIYAKTTGKKSVIAGIFLIPTLYAIAGATVFLFLLLVLLYDIHLRRKRIVYWVVISGLAFAIPFFTRHTYLLTHKQAFFYPYPDIKQLSLLVFALIV